MTDGKNNGIVDPASRRKFLRQVGMGVPLLTQLSQGGIAGSMGPDVALAEASTPDLKNSSSGEFTFDGVEQTRSEVSYAQMTPLYHGPMSKHPVISVKAHPEVIWVRPDMGVGLVANPFTFAVGDTPQQIRWREVRRSLQLGHLPIVTSHWKDGTLSYEQVAFATLLDSAEVQTGHEKQIAMVEMSVTSSPPSAEAQAAIWLFAPAVIAAKGILPPPYDTYALFDVVGTLPAVPATPVASTDNALRNGSIILGAYTTDPEIHTTAYAKVWKFQVRLRPGERKRLQIAISSNAKGFSENELEILRQLDFNSARDRCARSWRGILERGTKISVPEAVVNNICKAQVLYNQPQMVQAANRDYYMPVQGYLGVWPWEAMKMLVPLDAMGYHDDVRKSLDYFLRLQDRYPPFGRVKDYKGYFSGTGAFEESGWEDDPESTIYGIFARLNQGNKRGFPGWMNWTGAVLYAFAEHYFYSDDRAWLHRVAPQLTKACDWIIEERQQTKLQDSAGRKILAYGLMPAGEPYDNSFTVDMEHSLGYSFCFTDGYTCQGLNRIAEALAEIGHPEGPRLLKEGAEYRQDLLEVMRRVRERNPDLPPYPDHFEGPPQTGWADFAAGALSLVDTGFVAPNDPAFVQLENYMKKHYNRNAVGLTGGLRKDGDLRFPNAYYVDFSEDIWQRNWMLRGETEKALLTFYSTLAFGVDRQTLGSVERIDLFDERYAPFFMDASGSSRIVGMIRQTLLLEDDRTLHLLMGIPRRWLEAGKKIKVKDARTYFGRLDFQAVSDAGAGSIAVELTLQKKHPERLKEIRLRVPHPGKHAMKQVLVNGSAWQQFDHASEIITLNAGENRYAVVVNY